jgi:hypothetical protein
VLFGVAGYLICSRHHGEHAAARHASAMRHAAAN